MLIKIPDYINKHRFIKFAISGGTALFADYGSFLLLYYIFHFPLLLGNTIGFVLGFIVSFTFQRNWTFKSNGSYRFKTHQQLMLYLALTVVNLAISNLVIFVLNKKLFVAAVIAKLITVAIIAGWNFIIFKLFIFKETQSV